jgi:hypothetical protein
MVKRRPLSVRAVPAARAVARRGDRKPRQFLPPFVTPLLPSQGDARCERCPWSRVRSMADAVGQLIWIKRRSWLRGSHKE